MGADAFITQVITDASKDLLHFPCRDGENQVGVFYTVAQTVILNVLLDHERDCEDTLLSCLLLHDGKSEASAIVHDIAGTELHDIADPQPQVPFQYKSRCHAVIGTEETAAFFHGSDDRLILLSSQSRCFLVQDALPVRILGRESSLFLQAINFPAVSLTFGVRILYVLRTDTLAVALQVTLSYYLQVLTK